MANPIIVLLTIKSGGTTILPRCYFRRIMNDRIAVPLTTQKANIRSASLLENHALGVLR